MKDLKKVAQCTECKDGPAMAGPAGRSERADRKERLALAVHRKHLALAVHRVFLEKAVG